MIVFARADDYFFGLLHSRAHEVWALKMGTRLENRPRYTPTTCFDTFPLPQPTLDQEAAVAMAARELSETRSLWLNPPEWTMEKGLVFPVSANSPWERYASNFDTPASGTACYSTRVSKDAASAKHLAKRTLTNLYNARPAWLDGLHKSLDAAVFAAYGWPATLTDTELLERLLALNLSRSKG